MESLVDYYKNHLYSPEISKWFPKASKTIHSRTPIKLIQLLLEDLVKVMKIRVSSF